MRGCVGGEEVALEECMLRGWLMNLCVCVVCESQNNECSRDEFVCISVFCSAWVQVHTKKRRCFLADSDAITMPNYNRQG